MMCKDDGVKSKLSPCALGIAFGVVKGLSMMLFAWAAVCCGFSSPMFDMIASVYHGFAPTIVGGLIGGLWGLVAGFIYGVVLGFVYNFILCKCCCKKSAE